MSWLMLLSLTVAAPQPAAELTQRAILGVEIGMHVTDARRLLRPLGRGESRKLSNGTKEVWRLDGTGFEWIAMRSDADGRIVWITGHRCAGRELPFDLFDEAPRVASGAIAVWHVSGTYGHERLTLRGADRRARVVTLMPVQD